jgi:hypothetical protein
MILFPFDIPVQPDAGPARRLVIAELSKPEYRAAQPTLFDRLSSDFFTWLMSIRIQANGASQGPILLVVGIVIVVAIIAAYLAFGPPRLNRRSTIGVLFGEDDQRDATAMRRAAEDAARAGDYTLAIEECFRAIARGLAERTIVTVTPGTTAVGFASRASTSFPPFSDRLSAAATSFDGVRYLGVIGTEEAYRELADLDGDLASSRPRLPELATSAP